ncbi:MAG: hypothetical protein NC123_19005 [Butyrivibrio sp.]|nr:hypothetical protein [Butyrivibrio sp.]
MRGKLRKMIRDSSGDGFPLTAAVTLVLLMVMLLIIQYARLMITASGIKDALQEAVISTVNDNYADVYHAVREGYVAGYQPTGAGFEESLQYGNIYGRLDKLLGLQQNGEQHIHVTESRDVEYRIGNLQVQIQNNGLASGETTSFEAIATVDLEVPIRFIQHILPDMRIQIRTKAAYTPKF